MYSIVLMATLTVSADTPDFGRRRGGCHGCSGGYVSCHGCYGGGWGGCSGGGYGCYGGGGYGCSGGGMGYGCSGGGMGYGCYGGGMVYGCHGGGMIYGGPIHGCHGGVVPNGKKKTNGNGEKTTGDLTPQEMARFNELTKGWDAADREKMLKNLRPLDAEGREEIFKTIEEENRKAKDKGKDKDKDKDEVTVPTPANLLVVLPADATLKIDQAPTTSTTSRRVFVTPPLTPGKTFQYTLDAEVVRDGVRVTQTQQVQVRAGRQSRVIISFPEADVARR
jgi:uncharacterized protein (TIGR03000 family)